MADSPRPSDPTDSLAPPNDDPYLTPALKARSGGIIDLDIFRQITELDEEDDHEFSRGMVWDYFEQVETNFTKMDAAAEGKDLLKLSDLGHFLKGSSAALGLKQVQASCEKIQNYGKQMEDAESKGKLSPAEALSKIVALLPQVKREYGVARAWLRGYYKEEELPPESVEANAPSAASGGRRASDAADPTSANGLAIATAAATSTSSPPPRGSPSSPRTQHEPRHEPPKSPTTDRPPHAVGKPPRS